MTEPLQEPLFPERVAASTARSRRGREEFLSGMLATWVAMDARGADAKPVKGERELGALAARAALDALEAEE